MSFKHMRGCNHVPNSGTMSHNYKNILPVSAGGTFDFEKYRIEVQYLRRNLGVQLVRFFWSPFAYMADRAAFSASLAQIADLFVEEGIQVHLVLLDAVSGAHSWLQDPLLEPWYDLLGANGTGAWDPLEGTNPGMVNGSTGFLDVAAAEDTGYFDTTFPNRPRGYRGGGWLGAPGTLYSALFDMPTYPQVPAGHEAFWQGISAGMAAVVSAFNSRSILHSIDVLNEPEYILPYLNYAAIGSPQTAVWTEFWANVPQDPIQRALAGYLRMRSHIEWAYAAAAALAPGIPRTCGHVSPGDMIFAYRPFGIGLGCSVPEFLAFHSYGNGRLLADEISFIQQEKSSLVPEAQELDVVCNESYRQDQGDDHLLHYLYSFQEAGFGHITWDLFSTPNFGGAQSASYPPGGVPADWAWPITGIVRSSVENGTVQILGRRSDLIPAVARWAGGERAVRPPSWEVVRSERLSFFIRDRLSGDPLAVSDATHVYWRYLLVDDEDVEPNPHSDFTYVTAPDSPFSYFIGAGQWLDIDQEPALVIGSSHYVLPREVADEALASGKVVKIAAIFGDGPYSLLDFDEVRFAFATFGVCRPSEEDLVEPESDIETIRHAIESAARKSPFYRLPSSGPDYARADQPISLQVAETSAVFDVSRSRRTYARSKQPMTITLELRFRRRVLLESFEKAAQTLRAFRRDGTPAYVLELTDSTINHPPAEDSESGTSATYIFKAQSLL